MNQSMYLYNLSNMVRINQICAPLKKYLGINHFGYLKVYNESRYFYLSNDITLTKDYLLYVESSNIFHDQCLKHEYCNGENIYYILWPKSPQNFSMGLYLKYGYWNGLSILKINKYDIEIWWFATEKENTNIQEFYKKHLSLFSNFIHYFIYETKKFERHNQHLAIYEKGFDFNFFPDTQELNQQHSNIEAFLQHTCPKGINIRARNGSARVTYSEIKCLASLAKCNSIKEIAKQLNLSTRTVEKHIASIKYKLGYNLRSDLANVFFDQIENLYSIYKG